MLISRTLPLFVVGIVALSSAQSDHSKAFWVKKYNGIANMFATKNMDAFQATLDRNFIYIDDKGKTHSYADFVEAEIAPIRSAKKVGGTVKVTSVKAKGDDVAVSYDWRYSMVAGSPNGDLQIKGTEIGTDYWHKTNGTWLTVKTVLKKATSTEKPVK